MKQQMQYNNNGTRLSDTLSIDRNQNIVIQGKNNFTNYKNTNSNLINLEPVKLETTTPENTQRTDKHIREVFCS